MANKIKALYIKPRKNPILMEIEDDLNSLQDLVGGNIEMYTPFDDYEVAIICNEEGKINGLTPNRAIFSSKGKLLDFIAGNFLIVYAKEDEDSFSSLPQDMIDKYTKIFAIR